MDWCIDTIAAILPDSWCVVARSRPSTVALSLFCNGLVQPLFWIWFAAKTKKQRASKAAQLGRTASSKP